MHEVIRCARWWEEDGCVRHVNSNQGSDIHQMPWLPVRINLAKEELRTSFFNCASICHSCSLFPLCFSSVFLFSFIYPFSTYLSIKLTPPLCACQFASLTALVSFVILFFCMRVCARVHVCTHVITLLNHCFYLVGGKGCKLRSLIFPWIVDSVVTVSMIDGWACFW